MKLAFIGTGAADWNWADFPPGTRGATSTLVDGRCLIDFGSGSPRNLALRGVAPGAVRDLLVTHAHPDHFRPDLVVELAKAARRRLRVWASAAALADIPEGVVDKRPISSGTAFRVGACKVTVLPANHFVRFGDASFHFLLESRGKSLLYAVDGAWMLSEARQILSRALGKRTLDAVVWDATRGATKDDYRFDSHNNLQMISQLRVGMAACGLVGDATTHVFTHVSRQLWPKTPSARRRLAIRHGGILAEDGQVLEV